MKEKDLTKNIKEIRKALENIQKGMYMLINATYPEPDTESEDGDLSKDIPKIKKLNLKPYRNYLG